MKTSPLQEYTLASRLTGRIACGSNPPLEGPVTRVSQPFQSFEIQLPAELATSTACVFEFSLYQKPLLRGHAEVSDCQRQEDSHRVTFGVVNPGRRLAGKASQRLAPLIQPELREEYRTQGGGRRASDVDSVSPWIESNIRLQILLETLADINSTMGTESLLSSIMLAARRVVEAEASSLLLLDQETGELVVTLPTGPASVQILGRRIPSGQGIAGWVAENQQPVIVEDVSKDERFFGDLAPHDFQSRNLICVPMRSPRGEVIGILEAINRKGKRPFSKRDLPFILALADQAAIAIEKDRLIKESIQKQVLERELALASEIQKGFWPQETPAIKGIELFGLSRPAAHVGGDYFDFIQIGEHQLGLVVADVSGKGVAAALLMADLRASLRTQVENHHPPAETVSLVNNSLVGDTPSERFVTLFFGVLDRRRRSLTYVNAGHNPPVLFNSRSGQSERLDIGGPIIGFRPDLPFQAGDVKLSSGHRLILFSDGITEAEGPGEEMFGEQRLLELIQANGIQSAEGLANQILHDVKEFVGPQPQSDDMTLVVAAFEFD